jgi:iron(III) transport system ATP-binding protein
VADFVGVMNFVAGTVVRDGLVRLGAVELTCEADGFAPGTAVTVAIRPEDVVVQDVARDEPNSLSARVDALTFLGSFFRADLVSEALGNVLLRADLPVDLVRRRGIVEKSVLAFAVPAERIRVYAGGALHR